MDKPDPTANTPRQLSTPPVIRQSSPGCDPDRRPLSHPAPLPAHEDDGPTDWPAGSALHNSTPHLHKLRPPHPASSPPAPQTTRARICLADTPPPSRSTPLLAHAAPLH